MAIFEQRRRHRSSQKRSVGAPSSRHDREVCNEAEQREKEQRRDTLPALTHGFPRLLGLPQRATEVYHDDRHRDRDCRKRAQHGSGFGCIAPSLRDLGIRGHERRDDRDRKGAANGDADYEASQVRGCRTRFAAVQWMRLSLERVFFLPAGDDRSCTIGEDRCRTQRHREGGVGGFSNLLAAEGERQSDERRIHAHEQPARGVP